MERVRLNDTTLLINGTNVVVEDVFEDIPENEIRAMVKYLMAEGFLPQDGEIHVLVRGKRKEDDGPKEPPKD